MPRRSSSSFVCFAFALQPTLPFRWLFRLSWQTSGSQRKWCIFLTATRLTATTFHNVSALGAKVFQIATRQSGKHLYCSVPSPQHRPLPDEQYRRQVLFSVYGDYMLKGRCQNESTVKTSTSAPTRIKYQRVSWISIDTRTPPSGREALSLILAVINVERSRSSRGLTGFLNSWRTKGPVVCNFNTIHKMEPESFGVLMNIIKRCESMYQSSPLERTCRPR